MTWTYLQPRNSTVAASPAPTTTIFNVSTGTGNRFVPGPAVENGYPCQILSVVGDVITLASPLPYAPVTGEELVQAIIGNKDRVRFLCGDTDSTDPQLSDEEIALILEMTPNPIRAAANAAEAIAAQLSRRVTFEVYQEIQERLSDQAKNYFALAKTLRQQAARRSGAPRAGALSILDKQMQEDNQDRVKPSFTRRMQTEPGTEVDGEDNIAFIQPYY